MFKDLNVDQIKKLWILDLVIQQGSLKKAALKAKVSPSAISQSLTALEQVMGRPLLIREKGTVTPTQNAIALLEIVRPAFEIFDKLKDINQTTVPKISWLNFGTYESIAVDLLPGLIHALKEKLPSIRLGVRISRTSSLLTMVRKGELCSALIPEIDNLERFYSVVVGEDRLGFYFSRNHIHQYDSKQLLKQTGLGLLATGKDGLPRYFSKFLKQFDLPKSTIMSDSFETLRAAAVAGTIVSLLPHRVAMRQENLVEVTSVLSKGKSLKELGTHKLIVISQMNCDREETDFIAEESRRLLLKK